MTRLVLIGSMAEAEAHRADVGLAARMADELVRAYPGYHWAVNCDSKTHLADIRCMDLAGNWGYTLKMGEMYSWTDWAQRTRAAGGEILERFRAARRGYDHDQVYAALAQRRDFALRARPDL